MLMSKLAGLGELGVLGVDYRTTDAQPPSEGAFPSAVDDVIGAVSWLTEHGAKSVTLVGDSSGGTIVVQVLLELTRRRRQQPRSNVGGRVSDVPMVSGAVTFSAWLDLTDSSPAYHSHKYCSGECSGIGAQAFQMTPGAGQLKSMCDALKYAGNLSIADPRLSPAQAAAVELAGLPPLMLVIGGGEQLLGENLEFARVASAAGAAVQVEVFEGMWCGQRSGRWCRRPAVAGRPARPSSRALASSACYR